MTQAREVGMKQDFKGSSGKRAGGQSEPIHFLGATRDANVLAWAILSSIPVPSANEKLTN